MKKTGNMQRSTKLCMKLVALVICSVLIGTLLMTFLYAIPTDRSFAYARASADDFAEDMIYNWAGESLSGLLSYQTDALMISHAIYRPYDSVIENAMLNPRPDYGLSSYENLVKYLRGEEPPADSNYSRYWHGYLLYIIPALQFFTVAETKLIIMCVQMFLLLLVVREFGKRNWTYAFLFAVVALFLNPVTSVLTFQNMDIYCLMLIAMFVVLRYNHWLKQNDRYLYFFALNGILVAFFDYLTYPLAAYGVPLITVLAINHFTGREAVKNTIRNSLAWGWGYGGMWLGKWIVADILTNGNAIADAIQKIVVRTVGDTTKYGHPENTYSYAMKRIFQMMVDSPTKLMAVLVALGLAVYLFRKTCRYKSVREYVSAVGAIALIGITPFVWFLILKNHTIIHPHLEYRQLAVTVWAILVMAVLPFEKLDPEEKETGISD